MHVRVANVWFELVGEEGGGARVELGPGVTRLGGVSGPLPLVDAGSDRILVHSDPPGFEYRGEGTLPRHNGVPRRENDLEPGDRLEWLGRTLVFRRAATLREEGTRAVPRAAKARKSPRPAKAPGAPEATAPAEPERAAAPTSAVPPPEPELEPELDEQDVVLWRRVKSGLLVELGLVDGQQERYWQEAFREGGFDPDECADDLLAHGHPEPAEKRIADRATRLQRDLLMAPLNRGVAGARRRVKTAAKQGLAYLLVQFLIVAILLGLSLLAMLVGRVMLGWSIDGFLDGVSGLFGG